MIEIIGIIATLFVLGSFCFKNPKIIRSINMIGAAIFIIYGILISSISVWLLNACLILIHLYYLFIAKRK